MLTPRVLRISVLALSLSAVALILAATRWGPGLSDDSYHYLKPSLDALAGRPFHFSPQFPPLFAAILIPFGVAGIDPIAAVRVLNAALFSVSVGLVAVYILEITQAWSFALLGAALFLISSPMILSYSRALSESLYITLTLLAGLAIGRFLRRGSRCGLWAAGVAGGLAFATRYVGAALVGASVLTLLTGSQRSWRRKTLDGSILVLAGLLPVSMYMARNTAEGSSPTGHGPFLIAYASQGLSTAGLYNILTWFLPGRLVRGREVEAAIACLLILIVGVVAAGRTGRSRLSRVARDLVGEPLVRFLASFAGGSFIVLLIARGFVKMGDTFNERYIAPVYPALLILIVCLLATVWRIASPWGRGLVAVSCAALAALLSIRGLESVIRSYEIGDGYSGRRWHESETLAYMMRRPEVQFATTTPAGFYFWTGNRPEGMPAPGAVTAFKKGLCEAERLLVIVNELPPEFYGIETEDLVYGLSLVREFSEGSIWECARVP